MDLTYLQIIVSIITFVISTIIAFYIKDKLQKYSDFKRLRDKLSQCAGKNAMILYSFQGQSSPKLFRIFDISKNGVIIENNLQKVYIPIQKLLNTEIILPKENYETLQLEEMKKDFEKITDVVFPPMLKKIKEQIIDDMISEEGELQAVVGLKISKALEDAGFKIERKKIEDRNKIP